MRARSGCADCAPVTRAVYDAHPPDPARARGDVPRHGLSLLASSQKKLGLADRLRARSAARKTNHSHGLRTGRAMRRERRAADAPCGRFAFSKRPRRAPAAAPSGGGAPCPEYQGVCVGVTAATGVGGRSAATGVARVARAGEWAGSNPGSTRRTRSPDGRGNLGVENRRMGHLACASRLQPPMRALGGSAACASCVWRSLKPESPLLGGQ